jgi:hypothetical protein
MQFTYQYVKEYIENLGYQLISEEYINIDQLLVLTDYEGYYYKIRFKVLQYGGKPLKFHRSNPYTIYNIKLWCKLNCKPFKLLSEEYNGADKKLQWQCLKPECGEIFELAWASVSQGIGCGVCNGRQVSIYNCLATKNPELAKEWHPTKNGGLTPYDVTVNSGKDVWWQCSKNPKHEWVTSISNRNGRGDGCQYCLGRLPSEDYNLLIKYPEICEDWDYDKNDKLPKEYTPSSNKKVAWKCNKCGYEWQAIIGSRTKNNGKGNGCPQCNESKGEKVVSEYLQILNICYVFQKTFDGLTGLGNGLLSYDFYLPDYNLLIEYQGEFHDGSGNQYTQINLEYQQEHDRRKRKYAKQNNINLLEIWYYDFDRIEEILDEYLEVNKQVNFV